MKIKRHENMVKVKNPFPKEDKCQFINCRKRSESTICTVPLCHPHFKKIYYWFKDKDKPEKTKEEIKKAMKLISDYEKFPFGRY